MNRFLHRLAGTSFALIFFVMEPAPLVGGLDSIALAQSNDPSVGVLVADVFGGKTNALNIGLTGAFTASNANAASTEQFVLGLLATLASSQNTASKLGSVMSSILAAAANNPALQAAIGQGIGVAVAALGKSNPGAAQAISNAVTSDSNAPQALKTGISQGLQRGIQTFGNSPVASSLSPTLPIALPPTNPVNTVIPTNPLCTTGSCH